MPLVSRGICSYLPRNEKPTIWNTNNPGKNKLDNIYLYRPLIFTRKSCSSRERREYCRCLVVVLRHEPSHGAGEASSLLTRLKFGEIRMHQSFSQRVVVSEHLSTEGGGG